MTPSPVDITFRRAERRLELRWDDGRLTSCGYDELRARCPCALCRGHSPGEVPPPVVPEGVEIAAVEPVGRYAIRLCWNDGHETGIYSYDLLLKLTTG
jgi:DUF971 family protein